jgi:hypothetical protein
VTSSDVNKQQARELEIVYRSLDKESCQININ